MNAIKKTHPSQHALPTAVTADIASDSLIEAISSARHGMPQSARPMFDGKAFRKMVTKGTKAWADVPDNWLADLRGNIGDE